MYLSKHTGVVNIIQTIFNNLFSFRYTWRKNGKPYDWQVYDDRISQQPGRGTLVITSPRDEDIGMYFFTCFFYCLSNSYIY